VIGPKALVVFTLLTGIFAEQCDLKELDIEAFAEQVIVTNVSTGSTASVLVFFNHSETSFRVPGGSSRTASGLLATEYRVSVIAPTSSRWNTYRERLKEAREDLIELSLNTNRPPDEVAATADTLLTVVAALGQVSTNEVTQTCAGTIEPGVPVNVTIEARYEGGWIWVLDCG
jgi:hypothetical protein